MTTRAEQETIIQWDQETQEVNLYTAFEGQATRWAKLGYEVIVVDRDKDGTPTSWEATAEKGAIRFRRVRDGKVVKRKIGSGQLFVRRQPAEQPRDGQEDVAQAHEGQQHTIQRASETSRAQDHA